MIDRVAVTCSPTWPRSLLHHSSSSPASSSVLTSVESMDSLEGFDSSESGFIATRPSIADFMAAVPNLGEHHNNNNNIAGGNHVNSTSPATPNSLFCGQGGNIGGSATQPNNATGNTSSTNGMMNMNSFKKKLGKFTKEKVKKLNYLERFLT